MNSVFNRPTQSSRHERWSARPVALLGGVAIFVACSVGILLFSPPPFDRILLLSSGATVFALGLVDDIVGLSAGFKIVAEALVALALCGAGFVIRITPYPLLDIFITMVWIIGATNAINLLDNMDGLAAGIAGIGAVGLLGLTFSSGNGLAAVLAACRA